MEDSNETPDKQKKTSKQTEDDGFGEQISIDTSNLPEDGGFDTIGFDYNHDDLEKTPIAGTPIGGFNPHQDTADIPVPLPSTASQLAAVMAEFGFNVPEQEPDLEALQKGLVAIDFGSSDAVVACFNKMGKAVVVNNSSGARSTPTRLLKDHNEWLIGREAKSLAPSLPDQDFGELKSLLLMGGWTTVIDEQEYSAENLLATFVKRLIEDIGSDGFGFAPSCVALAAPVWFQPQQRETLALAVAEAGLEVVGVTDELLAACVPYSLRLPDLQARQVIVVDIGHKGTSAAFIECSSGDISILCQAGLPTLGAVNWDELLLAEAVRKFVQHHEFDPRIDPSSMTDLNGRVEQAKRALSSRRQYNMPIHSNGKSLKVRFTRKAFEKASQHLLKTLKAFLNKFLEKSEFDQWQDFEALVITGGGARIPMIKDSIESCVGRPAEPFNAEENVAIGALYWGVSARHRAEKAREEEAAGH